jgi:methylated-DNA-protein-cysteine methyltransferase-like protein
MAGSPFFARIKADVLRILGAVPEGHVVTFADVGAHLDVAPRHVAYIAATLTEMEKATLPWHRAVAADGSLGTPKRGAGGEAQAVLLAAEGITLDTAGRIAGFAARRIAVADVPHGVPPQTRPPEAPPGTVRPAAPPRRRRSPRSAR